MPPMPVYYVGKGSQFGVLDMFDGARQEDYEAALRRLESSSLLDLARRRADAGGLTRGDVQHFHDEWLGEPGATVGVKAGEQDRRWWPDQHVELVLRAGIRKALELALPNDEHGLLAVEALWVCAAEGVFYVYVNEGPRQVTIIVYTPPPKYSERERELDERIWVIKARDDYDAGVPGEIRRLNPDDDWPVLIERRLRYAAQTNA